MTHSSSSTPRWLGPAVLVAGIVAVLLAVLAIIALAANQGAGGSSLAAIPTVAVLPSATPAIGETTVVATQSAVTDSPTVDSAVGVSPTAQPGNVSSRATLPPTWTVTPTLLPTTTPSPTPTQPPPTRAPTLSPAQLDNTYWEGDGEGGMAELQFEDGSFARFTLFPVNFWVGAYGGVQISEEHEAAIANAIREISQVVPIQRVQNRAFAHITLWLMTDEEFNNHAGCSYVDMTVGCTSSMFTDIGILLNSVWMRVTDECFADTLLHELTHALGILVHSPDRGDIMYFMQTCAGPHYSQRDLNTLRALYAAPAYDPRHQ